MLDIALSLLTWAAIVALLLIFNHAANKPNENAKNNRNKR